MKQDTQQLIESLAQGAAPVKPMHSPGVLVLRLAAVLLLYAVGAGLKMGLRPDIAVQFHRPCFLAEIILLVLLAISSLSASVYLAFPDQYQHPSAGRLPLYAFGAFVALLSAQAFTPLCCCDPRMMIPLGEPLDGMDCTLCIASIAMIPSALMFMFLRRGASSHPPLAGVYTVLAAASVGCLLVRLEEANDSLLHLTVWHYLPTLLFAAIGGLVGKLFLKW